jgi:predicted dehydrogenase
MSDNEIRVALVGVGGWGSNILRTITRIDSARLTHICDTNPARLRTLAALHPGVSMVDDHSALVNNPEIDAVLIATPAPTHARIAEDFFSAGKGVFVEKPLTLSLEDAQRLERLSREKPDRPLMVGHLLIYHPATAMIKNIIGGGELGEIYYIYTKRLNLGVVREDENVLWSLAPHDISILIHLMGEAPEAVSAHGGAFLNRKVEDIAFMTLFFSGGRMGEVHVSWLDPNKERKTVVVGSRKMLVFDDMEATEKIRIYDKGAQVNATADFARSISIRHGDIHIPLVSTQEPLMVEIRRFVECVRDKKRPDSDARQGLEVVQVLTAAGESMRDGGRLVRLKP